jgi:hypothetical protein
MRRIEREGEKKVLLDTANDTLIWGGREHHPGQNAPTRWLDLHLHEGRSGTRTFYLAHHSRWQGESSYIERLTLDEARLFVEEHYDDIEASDDDLKGWGLFDMAEVE